jgi:hypothetical protein
MMTEDDPLESLLGELLEAHDRRHSAGQPGPRRRAVLRRRRALGISVAVLALSASAAAAVVIETQRSAPLRGRLPQLLGSRYSLRVAPDLTAGHAAWCVALIDIRTRLSVLPDPTTCVSPHGGALVSRGGVASLAPSTGVIDAWLLFAIVEKGVPALRAPDGGQIAPISSDALPPEWRAAVTVQRDPSSPPGAVVTLVPVNARGSALSTRVRPPIVLATEPVAHRERATGDCRVMVRGLPGAQLRAARAIPGTLRRSLPLTPGFLSCFSARLNVDRRVSTVAVLLNSRRPGRTALLIPGSTALKGSHGVRVSPAVSRAGSVTSVGERLFSRRAGHGWIVLATSAPAGSAVRTLEHLIAQA